MINELKRFKTFKEDYQFIQKDIIEVECQKFCDGYPLIDEDGTFTMSDFEVTVTATFKANENPNTSDNILVYIIAGFVSLVLVGGAFLKFKKSSE